MTMQTMTLITENIDKQLSQYLCQDIRQIIQGYADNEMLQCLKEIATLLFDHAKSRFWRQTDLEYRQAVTQMIFKNIQLHIGWHLDGFNQYITKYHKRHQYKMPNMLRTYVEQCRLGETKGVFLTVFLYDIGTFLIPNNKGIGITAFETEEIAYILLKYYKKSMCRIYQIIAELPRNTGDVEVFLVGERFSNWTQPIKMYYKEQYSTNSIFSKYTDQYDEYSCLVQGLKPGDQYKFYYIDRNGHKVWFHNKYPITKIKLDNGDVVTNNIYRHDTCRTFPFICL